MRLDRLLPAFVIAVLSSSSTPAAPLPASDNVVLITTDGLRWQEVFTGAEEERLDPKNEAARREFWRDDAQERRRLLMPFLWSAVLEHGQIWGNRLKKSSVRVANGNRFSYPGYQELLAGFPDPRIDSNGKKPNPNVTVLEWLNQRKEFSGRVAAFGSWDLLPYILNRERSGLPILAPGEDIRESPLSEREAAINKLRRETPVLWEGDHFDVFTQNAALDYLARHKPRVLYILYEETDEWAHQGNYPEYLRSIRRFDGFLREVWETLQSMPEYKGRTSLLVSTDHGRGMGRRWTDHGRDVPGAEEIWLAAIGPSVPPRGERADAPPATQSQIAATVAAMLRQDYEKAAPNAAAPLDFLTAP